MSYSTLATCLTDVFDDGGVDKLARDEAPQWPKMKQPKRSRPIKAGAETSAKRAVSSDISPDAKDRASQTSAALATPQTGKVEAAFDLWLERGLHRLFDDVANEPIPSALLDLIEGDRLKSENSDESK